MIYVYGSMTGQNERERQPKSYGPEVFLSAYRSQEQVPIGPQCSDGMAWVEYVKASDPNGLHGRWKNIETLPASYGLQAWIELPWGEICSLNVKL